MVQDKEGLKTKFLRHRYHFFLYSIFFAQKHFKTIINKVLRIDVILENTLLMMVQNIEFRPVRNNFLSKLKDDVKVINNTKEIFVNADKSTNIYK